jgi:hypothetical protein
MAQHDEKVRGRLEPHLASWLPLTHQKSLVRAIVQPTDARHTLNDITRSKHLHPLSVLITKPLVLWRVIRTLFSAVM